MASARGHSASRQGGSRRYNAILIQAVCDHRLAEALYLPAGAQKCTGASPTLNCSLAELSGHPPAPGYPACPEHTEKGSIWELLGVEQAIRHEAHRVLRHVAGGAVTGWYFSPPESKYFAVAQIQPDQVEDYAQRKA